MNKHQHKWGRWWQGRDRKMRMRESRICVVPGCKRKQSRLLETDEEFFAKLKPERKAMTSAKPTPPPWRTEAVSDGIRVVVGQGRQKIVLARLSPKQISEHETAANASLMAASQELLVALKGFVDEECHCLTSVQPCVQCVARAAIEKAEKPS
jgi:hypothetical protein